MRYEEDSLIIYQEFEQLLNESNLEFQHKENELMSELTKQTMLAAKVYAIENGFDYVFS